MITIVRGDLLRSRAAALVIPVNTWAVAGSGLARAFAEEFPGDPYLHYVAHCRRGRARLGEVWDYFDTGTHRRFVYFPTKAHWREKSQLPRVIEGLESLCRLIEARQITSIAVPALGCGLGGLAWSAVCPEIEKALGSIPGCNVDVYQPREGKR